MSKAADELSATAEVLRRRVPVDEFSFSYARSRGPGGQNVNKVNTRATLLFDVQGTHSLTNRQKDRIRAKLGNRITKDGYLRVVSMRHRTQAANRRAAIRRFYELIALTLHETKIRRPTIPSVRVRRRRLEDKRKRGQQKRLRSRCAADRLHD